MTNEEKAREICRGYNYYGRLTPQGVAGFAVDRCKEMAEWKDQQFGSIIAQVRKWLDEQGKLDQLDLVEFDMEIEKCREGQK